MVQQVASPPKPVPGVIHRPQVQLIQNNVVTLSNVQGPADISSQSHSSASPHTVQHSPQSKSSSVSSSKHIPPTLQAVNNRGVLRMYMMEYYHMISAQRSLSTYLSLFSRDFVFDPR